MVRGEGQQESATTAKHSSRSIPFARTLPPSHLVEVLSLMAGSIYGRLRLEQYQAWHGVLAFYGLIRHTTQGSPTGSWRDCGPARREFTGVRLSRVAYMHFQGMGVNCDRAKVGHKILLMADEDASRPCRTSLSYRVMNGELLEFRYPTQDSQRIFFLRPHSHEQIQNDFALRRFSKGAFGRRLP